MHFRKTIIGTIAVATLAAAGLAGCSSNPSSASDDKASGTITAWARASDKTFMADVVDGFNQSQHDVTVKLTIVPDDQFVQKFGSASSTGSGPDVAAIDSARIQYFASVGALADISDRVSSLSYAQDLAPAQTQLARYDGKSYALPFSAEASVLFRNTSLFEKAGLPKDNAPRSYADVIHDADAVTDLGGDTHGFTFAGAGGGANNFGITPFVWASGGSLLSSNGKRASFDSSEVTDLLTMLKTLRTNGDLPPAAATDTGPNGAPQFLSGKVGMFTSGAFFVNQLLESHPDFDWDISLIPGKDGGTSSFTGGDELAIPSGSKNQEAAWKFMQYATAKSGQTVLAKRGVVPVRTDLSKAIYTSLDPRYATLAKAVTVGQAPKTTLSADLFGDTQSPLATMINSAVFGDKGIEQAQQAAQKSAQQIIDERG